MISVHIPVDKVFVEVEDRESPWGTSEVVVDEVIQWIQDRFDDTWDYEVHSSTIEFLFEPKDRNMAILFKLVWGGE